MSNSHNGIFSRLTNDNGQNVDIYENPSEHYAGIGHRGSGSPFFGAFRKAEAMPPAAAGGGEAASTMASIGGNNT